MEDLAFSLPIDFVISSTDDLADAFKTEDAAADDGCQDVGASDNSVAAEDTPLDDGDAVAAVSNAAAVVAASEECRVVLAKEDDGDVSGCNRLSCLLSPSDDWEQVKR